jgi:hypothetical protein
MKKFWKGCLIAGGIFIGLLVIIVIIGMISSGGSPTEESVEVGNLGTPISETKIVEDESGSGNDSLQQPEITPTIIATIEIEEPTPTELGISDNGFTFEDICNNSTSSGKTELEWDTYKKKVVNTYFVDREAVVEDVTEGLFGGYSLVLNPGQTYDGCGLSIYIETSKEEGLNYSKGQNVKFSGKVATINQIMSDVMINLDEALVSQGIEKSTTTEMKIGEIGIPEECGNSFTITVLEPPELSKGMGYGDRAVGTFFILKLEIMNTGSKTYDGFDEDYFKLLSSLNDKPVEFSADWDASWSAARRKYGYKFLSDEIPPGLPWKTQVAFDINPEAKDFVFLFVPRDNYFDSNNICEIKIAVPKE